MKYPLLLARVRQTFNVSVMLLCYSSHCSHCYHIVSIALRWFNSLTCDVLFFSRYFQSLFVSEFQHCIQYCRIDCILQRRRCVDYVDVSECWLVVRFDRNCADWLAYERCCDWTSLGVVRLLCAVCRAVTCYLFTRPAVYRQSVEHFGNFRKSRDFGQSVCLRICLRICLV